MADLADARKQAEEALRVYDHECKARPDCVTCTPRLGMALRALRALLTSEPAKGEAAEPTGTRSTIDTHGVAYAPPAQDAVREAAERLVVAEARLERIDAFAGERCEASGCRPDPCGPVEYHDVEGVPLCAECWQECVDDAALAAAKGGE